MPEESEIEEAEAGAVEAVLPALPSEDAMAGEMETESSGQATEMPAPDCYEGGGDEDTGAEVLETVTEAQDLPGSTPVSVAAAVFRAGPGKSWTSVAVSGTSAAVFS